jgi:3-oxoacyl-(acyl-carrier-protein) synthase
MELAGSLCGIAKGEVFPTLNHHQTDPECPIDVIRQKPKPWSENLFAKTSFTCSGQAASVIMKRF